MLIVWFYLKKNTAGRCTLYLGTRKIRLSRIKLILRYQYICNAATLYNLYPISVFFSLIQFLSKLDLLFVVRNFGNI